MSFWAWMKRTYLSGFRNLRYLSLDALNFWMYFIGTVFSILSLVAWIGLALDGTYGRTWFYLPISFGLFILGNYGWYREHG